MFKKRKRWKKYHEGYLFRDRIINREVDDVARQMYRLAEKATAISSRKNTQHIITVTIMSLADILYQQYDLLFKKLKPEAAICVDFADKCRFYSRNGELQALWFTVPNEARRSIHQRSYQVRQTMYLSAANRQFA